MFRHLLKRPFCGSATASTQTAAAATATTTLNLSEVTVVEPNFSGEAPSQMQQQNPLQSQQNPLQAQSLVDETPITITASPANTNAVLETLRQSNNPNINYNIIKPKFAVLDQVLDPECYVLNLEKYDLKKLNRGEIQEIITKMKQMYHDIGLVLLTNTGLTQLADMREWANVIVEQGQVYTGGANPRKPVEKNVYDVGAPKEAWLHYHHEMAYVSKSPLSLSLFCQHSLGDKGWTYCSDSLQATDRLLKTPFGQKLKEKQICYIRNLTDKAYYQGSDESEVYNHWQDSFLVDDPELVESVAASRGLKIEWDIRGSNRFLKTRYYTSAFEYFPQLDRNVLYSSVADDFMWFDTWPGIDTIPADERPLKLTFGDDTEMTQEERQQFVDIYDQFGFPIRWKVGDIAVMCNYRFAHGRPSYSIESGEKRDLGVVIGKTFDRVGQRDDKW